MWLLGLIGILVASGSVAIVLTGAVVGGWTLILYHEDVFTYQEPAYYPHLLEQVRSRSEQRKSMLGIDPNMTFDLSSMPPDSKIILKIQERHRLAVEQMPGGLKGRSYGLNKEHIKHVVPDKMKGFVKSTEVEYRGVLKGMKSKKVESRKVDLKIGQTNKIQF